MRADCVHVSSGVRGKFPMATGGGVGIRPEPGGGRSPSCGGYTRRLSFAKLQASLCSPHSAEAWPPLVFLQNVFLPKISYKVILFRERMRVRNLHFGAVTKANGQSWDVSRF